MSLRNIARRMLRKLGFEVYHYNRMRLLEHHGIDLVLDVGANAGQYGRELRAGGYRGRIVSFEPLSAAYRQLERCSRRDPQWQTANMALGAADESTDINVSQHSVCSSLLPMAPLLSKTLDAARYVTKESIAVRRLDSVMADYQTGNETVLLKMDTQGYERFVLEGADQTLPAIAGIQMEVSLSTLYEGEWLLPDVIPFMHQLGFCLESIEPGFSDTKTGQLLQVDVFFFRAKPESTKLRLLTPEPGATHAA